MKRFSHLLWAHATGVSYALAAGMMALCFITLMTTPTRAADLAEAAPAPLTIEEPAGFSWTGGYVGAVGTYGWGDVQDVNNPSATSKDINGGLGGITLGYNYQFDNNVVLGGEIDARFGKISEKWGGANQFDPYYGEDSITSFGTARLRAGYAMDRFLPYVTGGLAWANFEHRLGCDANRVAATRGCQNRVAAFDTKDSDFDLGYTVGAGVEYAVSDRISVKVEYLYSDFGKHKVTLNDPNYPTLGSRNFDSKDHSVSVGLNYHF